MFLVLPKTVEWFIEQEDPVKKVQKWHSQMLLSDWTLLNVFNSVPNGRPEFQTVLELIPVGGYTVISKLMLSTHEKQEHKQ